MKYLIVLTLHIFFIGSSSAQIGIGTNNPDGSAILDMRAKDKGMLVPRMTSNERLAIANPARGLMIYQVDGREGFWYFTGTQWSTFSSGKHTIYINDDISNAEAQAKIEAEYGYETEGIIIHDCSNLTQIDLSAVKYAVYIRIRDNPVLQSVNLNNWEKCDGFLDVENCPNLTSLPISSLAKITGILWIRGTGLSSFSAPLLTKCIGSVHFRNNPQLGSLYFPLLTYTDELFIAENQPIVNLDFPALTRINGSLSIYGNQMIPTISFPQLTTVKRINIEANSSLASVSLPVLSQADYIIFNNCNSLNSLNFPSLLSLTNLEYGTVIDNCTNLHSVNFNNLTVFNNTNLKINHCSLTSVAVNSLLAKMASISPAISGKTIDLSNNTPPAPPTGQGITDANTLTAAGNSVITD